MDKLLLPPPPAALLRVLDSGTDVCLHLLQDTDVFESACKEQQFGMAWELHIGPYGQRLSDLDDKQPFFLLSSLAIG